MKTAAVILAGGKGTRSANPSVPKIAQTVGEKSLLQWHLNLLRDSSVEEVHIVTGHLGEQVAELIAASDTHGLTVLITHEERPAGTVRALQEAAHRTRAQRLLTILGDIWTSFDVDTFLVNWDSTHKPVAAIVHPSTHPYDSDAVIPNPDRTVRVIPKGTSDTRRRNMSATGVFGLQTEFVRRLNDCRDIGSDVLKSASESGDLLAYISSHYFKDTGTPERLNAAEHDWSSGAFARRGSTQPRAGLILDRDGVINPNFPEIYSAEAMSLLPGVADAIGRANRLGIPVLVATNQPGLAKGFMTDDQHEAIRARLDELLMQHGAFLDDYVYCPHHPEAGFPGEVPHLKVGCTCRKPSPGMLDDLVSRHGLQRSQSIIVGDSDRDEGAAAQAGVGFMRAGEACPPATAIDQAAEELAC